MNGANGVHANKTLNADKSYRAVLADGWHKTASHATPRLNIGGVRPVATAWPLRRPAL